MREASVVTQPSKRIFKTHGKHAKHASYSFVSKIKQNRKSILFYVLITAIYFMRGFFLESDLPPWGVAGYQPIDEGIYASLALNLFSFGSIDPNDYYAGQYDYLMQSHVICNVVGNAFVALSLFCFGDNYFGLRMSVVFVGYLVLILFCLTIKEIRKAYGVEAQSSKTMAALLIVALVASFVFFNATKAVEPTIFRLLFVQLIVYLLIKTKLSIKLRGFLVGFLVFVSIFLVYVTNLFIGIPVIAYAIYVFATQGKRPGGLFVLFGLIGAALALALATMYYLYYWDTTAIANAINSVVIFESSGKSGNAYAVGSVNPLKNIRAFLASNAFFYCLPIAGLVLTCFIMLIKRVFQAKDGATLVLLMTFLGFFAQTIVSDDFVFRKAVIVLPVLLLLFYCGFLLVSKHGAFSWSKGEKGLIALVSVASAAVMIYITYYRLFKARGSIYTKLDFSQFDIMLLVAYCAISVSLILVFLVGGLANKKRVFVGSFYASVLICIAVNLCLVFNYNILNQTYTEKEAMIELGETANGKIVAGQYETGFLLYNDILPLHNYPDKLAEYLKDNDELLYFDYEKANSFSKDPDSIYQNIEEVEKYERAFQTFGKSRDVSLYKPNSESNETKES